MTIEPFDAVNPPSPSFQSVLAETRKIQTIHDFHLDRLAAAHNEELRSAAAEKEAAEREVQEPTQNDPC